jgi:hypothetical protein
MKEIKFLGGIIMLTLTMFICIFTIAYTSYAMGKENERYNMERKLRLKEINELKERLG